MYICVSGYFSPGHRKPEVHLKWRKKTKEKATYIFQTRINNKLPKISEGKFFISKDSKSSVNINLNICNRGRFLQNDQYIEGVYINSFGMIVIVFPGSINYPCTKKIKPNRTEARRKMKIFFPKEVICRKKAQLHKNLWQNYLEIWQSKNLHLFYIIKNYLFFHAFPFDCIMVDT